MSIITITCTQCDEFSIKTTDVSTAFLLSDGHRDICSREGVLDGRFLDEMAAWSLDTFGPGDRLAGVLDHMAKEIEEARANPQDVSEWADLAILAFDGAQRQGISGQEFIDAFRAKFAKNRSRVWPDWRTAPEGKAIEHDRSHDGGVA